MSANKTTATRESVEAYLAAIEDEERRKDCQTIAAMMSRVTRAVPVMWGSSIVGFGSYHYRYESGREGDWAVTGFSSRKRDISVYLMASSPDQEQLLSLLGRHRMGKACLYIRRLVDIDMVILEQLVVGSVAEIKRRYGQD